LVKRKSRHQFRQQVFLFSRFFYSDGKIERRECVVSSLPLICSLLSLELVLRVSVQYICTHFSSSPFFFGRGMQTVADGSEEKRETD